ncbi:bifunctional D-glycero-beta-D-manno-heptose-7-phosphate kinase/D-glycero-beta-D-manno-heptose 1-phosphate adenylyltransferase HldE [Candidatus Curculioniphilus buchneri]|uniref:bifunctional D-glycero-beta-D-manno-heptose-7-phosphate kinase/D-glycero-beta-D-manno-heptose 1-phosphate adenylyltransferase HldE n=1 Tax=Candidatus Curculioniphilus buchneri TaxID=690594 RepID=UPI00376F0AF3
MTVTFPDFQQANILIVGDVMLDRYWYGSSNLISTEAPVPIVKINTIEERPGGAANVAMNIAALGAHAHLIGLTGIDDAAQTLNTLLRKMNVTCNFIAIATHSTIIKLRILSRNQQLMRLDFEKNFDDLDAILLLERIQLALPQANALVLSDYKKGSLSYVQEIITLARDANVPVLIDPKGIDFNRYRGATLLTPNLSEFEAVVGPCKDEKTLFKRGMKLIFDNKLSALLITRSEKGMILLQPKKNPLYLETQTQEVYDVTGAGDTVIGVLAASLAAGNNLEKSCFLANTAAGVVVGKLGTSIVSSVELESAIRSHVKIRLGVMTECELKYALTLARKRGEKIVMTNGIFDILHEGHVSYLSNARRLGERLIVAVNSDESTKRLKGDSRPVNPLAQRMAVLSALKVVDWVVPFNEDTPKRIISNLLPDFLVKGGDHQLDTIAGSEIVLANGGNVKTLNFKYGCSTTNIINTIKNKK